jgi:hypothetical protein
MKKKKTVRIIGKVRTNDYVKQLREPSRKLNVVRKKVGKNTWEVTFWRK